MNPLTQLHLDFHTAPVIPSIGKDFCSDEFAKTIKKANIQSVNVFAKCHHGMCYHPTKVGVMNLNLTCVAPQELDCAFEMQGEYCEVSLPELAGHTMVVFDWE